MFWALNILFILYILSAFVLSFLGFRFRGKVWYNSG
jgi:hypothetical protein